jgi:hypothetical protein
VLARGRARFRRRRDRRATRVTPLRRTLSGGT